MRHLKKLTSAVVLKHMEEQYLIGNGMYDASMMVAQKMIALDTESLGRLIDEAHSVCRLQYMQQGYHPSSVCAVVDVASELAAANPGIFGCMGARAHALKLVVGDKNIHTNMLLQCDTHEIELLLLSVERSNQTSNYISGQYKLSHGEMAIIAMIDKHARDVLKSCLRSTRSKRPHIISAHTTSIVSAA